VLAHHYPTTPNLGDMTKYQEWPDDLSADLLCGGTPCQSYSIAGLRKGLDDPRGDLMLTYGAIAAKYRPRWLGWENVPGVLSSNGGRDFGTLLGLLGQLGYGYAYRILDAQYFGVPQRRRRVFVVGCLGNWRAAAAVLFERHSLQGHPSPSREKGQVVTPTLRAGASNGGASHGARSGDSKDELIVPVARALTTSNQRIDGETETFIVAHSLRGVGFDASEDGTGRGTPLVPVSYDLRNITSPSNRSNPLPGDPHHTLHKPADSVIAFDARHQDVIQYGAKAGPLDTDGYTMGLQNGLQVRRLTPRECERLQGFPDNYTLIPGKASRQVEADMLAYLRAVFPGLTDSEARRMAADGPRYKAIGNSWAVPCARWIGQRINAVDALLQEVSE
jgi:DNA (cytosine-5)-methyltransferase 1